MSDKWKPIEKYDALKRKPKFAVFYVEADIREREYASLPEMLSLSRSCGNRKVTKYQVIKPPSE